MKTIYAFEPPSGVGYTVRTDMNVYAIVLGIIVVTLLTVSLAQVSIPAPIWEHADCSPREPCIFSPAGSIRRSW